MNKMLVSSIGGMILMGKQNYSYWNLYLCQLKHHGTQRKDMSIHGVYWVVN